MADDIAIINQPLRKHESKSGKVRFSISMKSEALVIGLDAKTLGDEVAKTMAAELRRQVEGITAEAAPATIKARESAARAFAGGGLTRAEMAKTDHGKREIAAGRTLNGDWAQERYSGGKLGPMPPNQSRRAFNDSGRFARGIAVQAAPGKWRINVPANRLDPQTGNVTRIWARLIELVPAFANVGLLMDSKDVREGVERGLGTMIAKAKESGDQLSVQRAKNMLALIARIVIAASKAA